MTICKGGTMELVPEIIDGVVVVNAENICSVGSDCRSCSELAVGVHNWLVTRSLKYFIIDFQDEKEVCETILAEIIQLKKRMDIPFLFCGVMTQAREYLKAYAYSEYPFFDMPGEAADYLKANYPRNLMVKLSSITEGEAIAFSRSQLRQKMSDFDEDDSYADNDI